RPSRAMLLSSSKARSSGAGENENIFAMFSPHFFVPFQHPRPFRPLSNTCSRPFQLRTSVRFYYTTFCLSAQLLAFAGCNLFCPLLENIPHKKKCPWCVLQLFFPQAHSPSDPPPTIFGLH